MRRGTSDRTAGAHHRAPAPTFYSNEPFGRLRPELLRIPQLANIDSVLGIAHAFPPTYRDALFGDRSVSELSDDQVTCKRVEYGVRARRDQVQASQRLSGRSLRVVR